MVQVPMTQEQFKAKAAQLRSQAGISLEGLSGTLSKSGVTASWSYDGKALTVTVTKKPWAYPLAFCEGKIRDWLTASGDSGAAGAQTTGMVG